MKDFDVVLKEIIRRTKGDTTKLQKIFGEESIRAISPLAQSFQRFGDFREYDAFVKLGGDGAMIMKDYAFWMGATAAKAKELVIEADMLVKKNLKKPIDEAAKIPDQTRKSYKILKKGITVDRLSPDDPATINKWSDIPNAVLGGWKKMFSGGAASAIVTEHPINLTINIDENDRVTTVTNDMGTKTTVELKRGKL